MAGSGFSDVPSIETIMSALLSGMIYSVDASDESRVLDTGLVTSIPDRIGGRSFAAAGAARPTDVAGPNAQNRAFRTSASTYLAAPDDAGLSLGDRSFLLAIVGMSPADATAYTVWAGNGIQASTQGVRFFSVNNGALGIYDGSDGAGTNSAFAPAGAVVNNNWSAMVWAFDALNNVCRFSSSETDSTSSVAQFTGGDIPDNGNDWRLNGGADGVYTSIKNIAYSGLWSRPATEGFSEADCEAVRDKLVELKLTA